MFHVKVCQVFLACKTGSASNINPDSPVRVNVIQFETLTTKLRMFVKDGKC